HRYRPSHSHAALPLTPLLHLFLLSIILPPPTSTLFPYTTLFRSPLAVRPARPAPSARIRHMAVASGPAGMTCTASVPASAATARSEEHTSELQSRFDLVCRLLLEKKKKGGSAAEETMCVSVTRGI